MAAIYERLYAESFSRRTLFAFGQFLFFYYSLLIVLYTLGGRWSWLSISFYLRHLLAAIPFFAVILARLRPAANPEKSAGGKIANIWNLWTCLTWFTANAVFISFYFTEFAPSYLVKYVYPEGKYGPPLMREQPFFLWSFAGILALFSYIRMVWKYRHLIIYHLDDKPNLVTLVINRFQSTFTRITGILGYSMLATSIWNILFVQYVYWIYALWTTFFRSIRISSHSFFEFVDLRLIYHLTWTGVSLLILYTIIEVVVEHLFGCCFHLCQGLKKPNIALLSGLQSPRAAVRHQAILELRHLTLNEVEWRESLFKDFIDDEAISKKFCHVFVLILQNYTDHLNSLNDDMRLFSSKFESCLGDAPLNLNSMRKDQNGGENLNIFSPQRKNIVENIMKPLLSESDDAAIITSKSNTTGMPDIFEVQRKRKVTFSPELGSESVTPSTFRNKYLQLTLFVFGNVAKTYPGRVYAAMSCELIKSWWLTQDEPLLWTLDCLTALITASYDEDCHGQVQFVMDEILRSMAELADTLTEFNELPRLHSHRMLEDLFGPEQSPTEKRAYHISSTLLASLEVIFEKFGDSLAQLKITPITKEKLRKIGFGW